MVQNVEKNIQKIHVSEKEVIFPVNIVFSTFSIGITPVTNGISFIDVKIEPV